MPLTAQQIVTRACEIAKCPGYTQQGGQYLNLVLVQNALQQDLDIIRRTTTLTFVVGQASYSLPVNYLRAREVFYNINGEIFYLSAKTLEQYDQLFQGPGEIDFPYVYATDIAQTPPLMYFYPAPSISGPVTVRYMDNNVEITTPETSSTIPYIQDQLWLVERVAEKLMGVTDDARAPAYHDLNDETQRRYLRMANDQTGLVHKVSKDNDSFRAVGMVRPTKLQGS